MGDVAVKALGAKDTYKYLGADVGTQGFKQKPIEHLKFLLDRSTNAPLKPQQRLYNLREFVSLKIQHQLVLSNLTKKDLKHLDYLTRSKVKEWLKMKISCSLGDMYASVKDGGMGLPCFLTRIPRLRQDRADRIGRLNDPLARQVADEISVRLPSLSGKRINNAKDEVSFWRQAHRRMARPRTATSQSNAISPPLDIRTNKAAEWA